MNKQTFQKILLCASALTASNILIGTAAVAQTAKPADAAAAATPDSDPGAITVTARRRTESIVDVPLAISVVTSAKLEQMDITDTTKLANFVPGLQFSDYTPGYARNDRGATRPLIFRGLNLGAGGGVTAAGGMFLDGAAVVGNEVPAGMDIGAVEVLRGPQSVYFGRATMTGAVSYRTKDIPTGSWHGEAEVELAQRNTKSVEATIAGPVIPGLLGIRVTGLDQSNDGYTKNAYDNSKLGSRSRKSISTTVELTPASNLSFKGYVNYFHDDDGASATAFVTADHDNCTLAGATYSTFCGKIPSRSASTNYVNTTIPTSMQSNLFSSPLIKGAGFDDKVGLQRNVLNMHLVSNWEISDYLKLQSITGYHVNTTLQTADGIDQPVQSSFPYQSYFYSIANKAKDFSQELRLSSDPNRRLSWTIGANYINAYAKTNAIVDYLYQDGSSTDYNQGISTDKAKTYGVFGGAYYKITSRLTASAEGRWQSDHRTSSQNTASLSTTFNSFNPRFSLDYDVGGGRKLYTSYSSGTRPGGFNANLASYLNENNAALTAQISNLLGLTTTSYKEERLKIGELGFKGNFAGGKGYFDINGYYGKLTNQQIAYGALIPLLGFSVVATSNIGESTAYGIEWQGNYNFTHDISLATTFSWNHTYRNKYTNTSGLLQYGTTDLSGTAMANTPQFSGSAILSYTHPINDKWNFFENNAYTYRGKQWVDVGNYAFISGRSQLDVRTGISNDHYTIEVFMTNAFNNRGYTGGSVAPDYGTATYEAFTGAVAEPRTVGGRVRVKF